MIGGSTIVIKTADSRLAEAFPDRPIFLFDKWWLVSGKPLLNGYYTISLNEVCPLAPKPYVPDWLPLETIPRDRKILIQTVNGFARVAKVSRGAKIKRARLRCGGVQAVAWKEIEKE